MRKRQVSFMIEVSGKSVYNAIAMGKLFFYKKEEKSVKREHSKDSEHEKKRFSEAVKIAKSELDKLYEKALLRLLHRRRCLRKRIR